MKISNKSLITITFIILTLSTISNHLMSINGIESEEMEIVMPNRILKASFLTPKGDWETNELPGVVVFHGFSGTKEMMRAFSYGLAKKGFAVLTVDLQGHGASSGYLGQEGDENSLQADGIAAVDYIREIDVVDSRRIGLIGHSMGAGTVLATVELREVQSVIIIGNSMNGIEDEPYINTTYPSNVLVAVGTYDELFSVDDTIESMAVLVNGDVIVDKEYGSFSSGTARKLITPKTDHIFEVTNPVILEESIEWMIESLYFGFGYDVAISSVSGITLFLHQVYSIITALTWLPLIFIVFRLRREELEINPAKVNIIQHGLISVLAFALGALFSNLFPAIFMGMFMGWFLFSFIFYTIWLSRRNSRPLLNELKLFSSKFTKQGVVTGLLAFLVLFIPLEILMSFVYWDFRMAIPLFSEINIRRFGIMLPMWIFGTIFFTQEIDTLRGTYKATRRNTYTAFIARSWPFLLILLIHYIPIFLFNTTILPGILGFMAFFLLAFVPIILLISHVVSIGQDIGIQSSSISIVISGLISWTISSTLPFGDLIF